MIVYHSILNNIKHLRLHSNNWFISNTLTLFNYFFLMYIQNTHIYMWPWNTKPVLSPWGIFVAIAKDILYGSKWIYIVNIFKLNFLLVICNDNNLICTVLKAIFSIFRFFQIPDNQIVVSLPNMSYPNKPYNNGKIIYSAFRCIHFEILGKIDPYDWFCGSGSLYIYIYIYIP